MSTLKVNKLRDTAGSADAITLDPNGGAVLAGVTTVTSVKVGAAVTISESGIEASGIGITCANINGGAIGGRRNIIINGAMQVAQRGTSSTTTGIQTVDRYNNAFGGTDEAPTQAQVDVASGTTPYTLGFRKAYKITNGNQTSGAGAADYCSISYKLESQDISNSGWNYVSSSSNITLSFWVKSSVAQNFYGYLYANNGSRLRSFETGSLSADTWTKVTKTISGDSNLVFNNDNTQGLQIHISQFWGTDYTDGSHSLNTWAAYSGSSRMPDNTSTWYTTNDATFELTGLQLEVGSQATPFEHRSYGEELPLCQRYYYRWTASSASAYAWMGMSYSTSTCFGIIRTLPVTMRATPTTSVSGTFYGFGSDGSTSGHNAFSNTANNHSSKDEIATSGWGGATGMQEGGRPVVVRCGADTDYIDASAELQEF